MDIERGLHNPNDDSAKNEPLPTDVVEVACCECGRNVKIQYCRTKDGVTRKRCRSCQMKGKRNSGNGKTMVLGYEHMDPVRGILVRVMGSKGKLSWKLKARILMEKSLGRELRDDEKVVYKDGNKSNCVIENLELKDRWPFTKYL